MDLELGYKDPKHYKVCLGKDHSQLLWDKKSHPNCPKCRKLWNCLDYYVLGLNFGQWFITEDHCEQLLANWEERDEWLNKPPNYEYLFQSELWHGQRFQDLSYFWDPEEESLLPEKCLQCQHIIPADVIAKTMDTFHHQVQIRCPHCKAKQFVVPCYMRGDPRNQAIIIHEDGWNPHSTSSRFSRAAITITNTSMSKLNRSHSNNAKVYSFQYTNFRKTPHTNTMPSLSLLLLRLKICTLMVKRSFSRQLLRVTLQVMTSPH